MCQCISILCHARRLLLGLCALAACTTTSRTRGPSTSDVAITHVTIVDPETGRASNDMTVVIRGRHIRSIGPAKSTTLPRGMRVTDATGKYLIPGLWDMHVHTLLDGREWALAEYVKHGITTVRDMGGQFEAVDSLRQAIAARRIVGPRIYAVGPMIENADAMRGILSNATREDSTIAHHDRLLVSTPDEATHAVDSLARLGVDMIKARDFADVPTYWTIANAARRVGRPFVGHPPPGVDPVALADSGQRSVEHWYYPNELTGLPRTEYERLVSEYAKHGTAFVPTLRAWHQHRLTVDTLEHELRAVEADPRPGSSRAALYRQWAVDLKSRRTEIQGRPATKAQLAGWDRALDGLAKEMGRLVNVGVVVLVGSDIPFATYPGEAYQEELQYLVTEAGFTPQQALAAGTIAAARFVGVEDSLGTVTAGKIADLVLLDASPLADIGNVRHVAAVMRDGRWVWDRTQSRPMETR